MFKFNNDHIFTGYLKKLLSSFDLPKYRVYTQEQRAYHQEYLKNYDNHIAKLDSYKEELELLDDIIKHPQSAEEKAKAEKMKADTLKLYNAEKAITPEKDVLITIYRDDAPDYNKPDYRTNNTLNYPVHMRYIPYIKDGKIQEYAPKLNSYGQVEKYTEND